MTIPTAMTHPFPGPYRYGRDRDGCDDLWFIFPESEPSRYLASVPFWDDVPGAKERTETYAQLFAAAPCLRDRLKALLAAVHEVPAELVTDRFLDAKASALSLIAGLEKAP